MARPREFDERQVLERAARVFWSKGYEGTSVIDLCEGTGLAKGSIYKAFGDKHSLYLRALTQYLEDGRAALAERLASAPSALAGLESWLRTVGEMAIQGGLRCGCFGVNATVELAPSDPEVRGLVERHARAVERLYAATIVRGVAAGEMRPDLVPEEAARFFAVVVHGLQALGRGSLSRAEIDPLVQSALRALAPG